MLVPVILGIAGIGAFVMRTRDNKTVQGTNRVLNRSDADGVNPQLQWLLDEWERSGTHSVTIGTGVYGLVPYVGGVRTLEQQQALFNVGLSKADSAEESPHMHGAALDVWPVGFVPNRSFEEQTSADFKALMNVFADFAEARGFVSGRRWGDYPHVELSDWRTLPLQGV